MHPAFSLVAFTVFSGLGFGMMVWLGIGLGGHSRFFAFLASGVAVGAVAGGLLASTRHLLRPDRAKLAFSQWRTSWLSREAVLAVAALAVFGLYAAVWVAFGVQIGWLGTAAALLAGATVYATGMIYRQLKTVPQWATPLTPACFVAFALASGELALAALTAFFESDEGRTLGATLFLLVIAWGLKYAWWQNARKATLESAGATPEDATGLGDIGLVEQLEAPHTGENYLMKEMVFEVGRERATALRRVAVGAGFGGALLLVLLSGNIGSLLLVLALASLLVGLMAERWLFFAEAQHAVAAYYGKR
ncbi:MAG: dibenzothiophene desulfurase [Rhodobacteraceae bacterium]|nr:MAG: dibenzothiophene desulfurase [Paracoccaceae bacterium]